MILAAFGVWAAPGCSWLLLAAPGFSWMLLAAPGRFWLLLATRGCPWLFLVAPGCSWLLLVAPGLSSPHWLTPPNRFSIPEFSHYENGPYGDAYEQIWSFWAQAPSP